MEKSNRVHHNLENNEELQNRVIIKNEVMIMSVYPVVVYIFGKPYEVWYSRSSEDDGPFLN